MRIEGLSASVNQLNIKSVDNPLSKMEVGDSIRAQVVNTSSQGITLRLSDGSTINAASLVPVDVNLGDFLDLSIKNKSESQVFVEVVKDQSTTQKNLANIKNILVSLDFPADQKNVSIIQELMKYNFSVNKENVQAFNKLLTQFKELTPEKAAFMLTQNIPITQKNVSLLNKLIDQKQTIGNNLTKLLQQIADLPETQVMIDPELAHTQNRDSIRYTNQQADPPNSEKVDVRTTTNVPADKINADGKIAAKEASNSGINNDKSTNILVKPDLSQPTIKSNTTVNNTNSLNTESANKDSLQQPAVPNSTQKLESQNNEKLKNYTDMQKNDTSMNLSSNDKKADTVLLLNTKQPISNKGNIDLNNHNETNYNSNLIQKENVDPLEQNSAKQIVQENAIDSSLRGSFNMEKAQPVKSMNSQIIQDMFAATDDIKIAITEMLNKNEITSNALEDNDISKGKVENGGQSDKSMDLKELVVRLFKEIDSTKADKLSRDIQGPKTVSELIDAVEIIKSKLETEAQNSGAKHQILSTITEIEDNLQFMQKINYQTAYVQIPFNMNGHQGTAELYVFKDPKTKKRIDPSNASVFLSLSTANLGQFETFIKVSNKNVECEFRVEDKETMDFVKRNITPLFSLLGMKGYKLTKAAYKEIPQNTNIMNVEQEKNRFDKKYSFDTRI